MTTIAEMYLPNRAKNALISDGITTLDQLTKMTMAEVLRVPHLGKRSLSDINLALSLLGRRLHEGYPPQPPPHFAQLTEMARIAVALERIAGALELHVVAEQARHNKRRYPRVVGS